MSGLEAALAGLDTLPDSSMSMLARKRDADGSLERPGTRAEVAAGLRDGTLDPESILVMAKIAAMTEEDLADLAAGKRRRDIGAV